MQPTPPPPPSTWVPLDVKLRWFSFLPASDLARCSQVCKSWGTLVSKTADVALAKSVGVAPLPLGKAPKLQLLHRTQHAHEPEHMGYLLSWAAGSREYLPFLHKLLLLRDVIREDLGLPGGLHEPARPAAYDELDDATRALWTYRCPSTSAHLLSRSGVASALHSPANSQGFVELTPCPPLVTAAARGNVEAIQLLLLFGEGVHPRRKGNERALHVAAEQGNLLSVAALLGRLPLRPPRHAAHTALSLGLARETWDVYAGPGNFAYCSGVGMGPRPVAPVIARTKSRAELAAAVGVTNSSGTVFASAAGAQALRVSSQSATAAITASQLPMPAIEAAVAQWELFEADGRYRGWCHGYHMGSYWATYDTSLANHAALNGPVGEGRPKALQGSSSAAASTIPCVCAADTAPPRRLQRAFLHSNVTLENLPRRLALRVAPGSLGCAWTGSETAAELQRLITPAFTTQALLQSRLSLGQTLAVASRVRRRGELHPRLPPPIDYGEIAAGAIAASVRVNVGPAELRTPLLAACERGRAAIAYLLLSHHDPELALSCAMPELPLKEEPGPGAGGAPGPGAGAAPGATIAGPPVSTATAAAAGGGGLVPAAVPAPASTTAAPTAGTLQGAQPAFPTPPAAAPTTTALGVGATVPAAAAVAPTSAASRHRAALADIASSHSSALAIPPDLVFSGALGGGSAPTDCLLGAPAGDAAAAPALLAAFPSLRCRQNFSEILHVERDRADVDAAPPGAHTPLCYAAERGDAPLAALLLHWGADPNRAGRKEARPIMIAASGGHAAVLHLLLRACCSRADAGAVVATAAGLGIELDLAALAPIGGVSHTDSRPSAAWLLRDGATSSRSVGEGERQATPDLLYRMNLAPECMAPWVCGALSALGGTSGGGGGVVASQTRGAAAASSSAAAILGAVGIPGAAATAGASSSGRNGTAVSGVGGSVEDPSIDGCEPAVVQAVLSQCAADSSAAQQAADELYFGAPALPPPPQPGAPGSAARKQPAVAAAAKALAAAVRSSGISPLWFLPPYELAVTAAHAATVPLWMKFAAPPGASPAQQLQAAGALTARGPGGSSVGAALGGAGAGRLTLLSGTALALPPGSLGGSSLSPFSSGVPEVLLTAAAERLAGSAASSAPSYTLLCCTADALRGALNTEIRRLLRRSRVCSGTGAPDSRPLLEVDAPDESGYTATFVSASSGRADAVALLLAAGADASAHTKRGKSALYAAVEKCHVDVVQLLLHRYTATQVRSNTTYGTNVLHAAMRAGNNRIKALLDDFCAESDQREVTRLRREAAQRQATMGTQPLSLPAYFNVSAAVAGGAAARPRSEGRRTVAAWGAFTSLTGTPQPPAVGAVDSLSRASTNSPYNQPSQHRPRGLPGAVHSPGDLAAVNGTRVSPRGEDRSASPGGLPLTPPPSSSPSSASAVVQRQRSHSSSAAGSSSSRGRRLRAAPTSAPAPAAAAEVVTSRSSDASGGTEHRRGQQQRRTATAAATVGREQGVSSIQLSSSSEAAGVASAMSAAVASAVADGSTSGRYLDAAAAIQRLRRLAEAQRLREAESLEQRSRRRGAGGGSAGASDAEATDDAAPVRRGRSQGRGTAVRGLLEGASASSFAGSEDHAAGDWTASAAGAGDGAQRATSFNSSGSTGSPSGSVNGLPPRHGAVGIPRAHSASVNAPFAATAAAAAAETAGGHLLPPLRRSATHGGERLQSGPHDADTAGAATPTETASAAPRGAPDGVAPSALGSSQGRSTPGSTTPVVIPVSASATLLPSGNSLLNRLAERARGVEEQRIRILAETEALVRLQAASASSLEKTQLALGMAAAPAQRNALTGAAISGLSAAATQEAGSSTASSSGPVHPAAPAVAPLAAAPPRPPAVTTAVATASDILAATQARIARILAGVLGGGAGSGSSSGATLLNVGTSSGAGPSSAVGPPSGPVADPAPTRSKTTGRFLPAVGLLPLGAMSSGVASSVVSSAGASSVPAEPRRLVSRDDRVLGTRGPGTSTSTAAAAAVANGGAGGRSVGFGSSSALTTTATASRPSSFLSKAPAQPVPAFNLVGTSLVGSAAQLQIQALSGGQGGASGRGRSSTAGSSPLAPPSSSPRGNDPHFSISARGSPLPLLPLPPPAIDERDDRARKRATEKSTRLSARELERAEAEAAERERSLVVKAARGPSASLARAAAAYGAPLPSGRGSGGSRAKR